MRLYSHYVHGISWSSKFSEHFFIAIYLAAYVCGEKEGLILEDPHHFGVSLNGVPGLDIDMEKKAVEDKLYQLQQEGATEDDIKMAMKDFGMKRLASITSILIWGHYHMLFDHFMFSFLKISFNFRI